MLGCRRGGRGGSNNNSSPDVDDGAGATGERAVGIGYVELPAELPKGEANWLESWARHGEVARLDCEVCAADSRRPPRNVVLKTRPLCVLCWLRSWTKKCTRRRLESEQVLGGYDYDELSESLVVKESEGKSELESDLEWPSGPVSEVEIPPVSVAGVERSRYKGAYQWACLLYTSPSPRDRG